MLEIKLCLDSEMIAVYSRKCRKAPSAALYLYLATNRGETLAAGLFEVGSDEVRTIYYETTEPDDVSLFDAVLRAGLNYAGEQGIPNGYIPDQFHQEHAEQFSRLNFPPEMRFNITNFFTKYKNCAPGVFGS